MVLDQEQNQKKEKMTTTLQHKKDDHCQTSGPSVSGTTFPSAGGENTPNQSRPEHTTDNHIPQSVKVTNMEILPSRRKSQSYDDLRFFTKGTTVRSSVASEPNVNPSDLAALTFRRTSFASLKGNPINQSMEFTSNRFIQEDCGGVRELIHSVRQPEECDPMSKRKKWRKYFTKAVENVGEITFRDADASAHSNAPTQYTVTTRYLKTKSTFDKCMRMLCFDRLHSATKKESPLLLAFLEFSFRTTFAKLFISQLLIFMTLIVCFAGIIAISGMLYPACIQGGDYENTAFADAFSLSWTTFSTVGYGSTYPSMGPEYSTEGSNSGQCAFIYALTSTEAFVGVLYAGFCGAVIFGKVLRHQSRAQVKFSDVVTIRYGTGVIGTDEDGELAEEVEDAEGNDSICSVGTFTPSVSIHNLRHPFPVLEFRVVNENCGKQDGEIIDANLNVLASFEDRASTFSSLRGKTIDPSKFVPKTMFRQVKIELKAHPFFQRVWYAKHILNGSSPLLTPDARRKIRKNRGFWPVELNNATAVRKSIHFNQLLVNFSGVSNMSTASVYAQKKYSDIDIVVGYQFVRCMYRDDSGAIKVDCDLVNDVIEQAGGGGEPF